ncbi:MAG TPA: hypothetical protein VMH81_29830 [Bryobacteraceae bacterium]|nr:hypothetical protein [Bryobacteraceae bacterium]
MPQRKSGPHVSGPSKLAYDPSLPHAPGSTCPVSAVRILYRMIYDAPGAWTDSEGHVHHGGGGPGDLAWYQLSPAARDDLTGKAILELAALTGNREVHDRIARAASALLRPVTQSTPV